MYIKTIFKFVHFERNYNVSKLVKIQHLILAMFVSNTRYRMRKGRLVKCITVNIGVSKTVKARAKLVTVARVH